MPTAIDSETMAKNRRRRLLSALLLGSLIVLASLAGACGGEDVRDRGEGQGMGDGGRASGERRQVARPPRPRESLEYAASRFGSAVRSEDCEAIRAQGSFGARPLEEQVCGPMLERLEGFRIGRLESYGTAGLADFTAERGDGTVTFLVGPDGRYRWATWSARPEGKSVVGSEPPSTRRLDRVAEETTAALRNGRCDELAEEAEGVLPEPQALRRTCERLESPRRQLAGDPEARPRRLGANSRYAFYSLLPQPRGPYITLILLQEGRRAALQRVVPVAAQRERPAKRRSPGGG